MSYCKQSCGFEINNEAYEKYALKTARKYVELYGWYYMPTAVHKLLMHGKDIIGSSLLPIGQLSEEAQEAYNKLFREFRLRFARKNYREKTMEDNGMYSNDFWKWATHSFQIVDRSHRNH